MSVHGRHFSSTLQWPVRVKRAAVFLDRDGTLNRLRSVGGAGAPPRSPEELEILPGVAAALLRLKQVGFALIVVSNQPDVSRGTQSRDMVECINDLLGRQLPVDEIVVCYHDDDAQRACRKPRPGMLVNAAARHRLDLATSYMVGDRWRDIGAGRSAGCTTILLSSDPSESEAFKPDFEARDLTQAVGIILRREKERAREAARR